jgi:hypothetical protein
VTVVQYDEPPFEEYVPETQSMQPETEFAPVSEYLPATQFSQEVESPAVSLYLPGVHDSQLEEPALEKPVPHGVQVSVAPVEKWFSGHSIAAVLSVLVLKPAGTFLQYDERTPENSPTPQIVHVVPSPFLPAEQSEHIVSLVFVQLEETLWPAPQTLHGVHAAAAAAENDFPLTQSKHSLVAPREYLPATQAAHELLELFAKVPAPQ